jgi:hypothetical protein
VRRFPDLRWMYERGKMLRNLKYGMGACTALTFMADMVWPTIVGGVCVWILHSAQKLWEGRFWGHVWGLHTSSAKGPPPVQDWMSPRDRRRQNRMAAKKFGPPPKGF